MHLRALALWSAALTLATASHHDQLAQHPITTPDQFHPATQTKNIAIIGAGSAGASTAYYLRNYTSHLSLPVNLSISVFERNSYIGGRSTTVDVHDLPSEPVELGASIFVTVNQNLVAAAEAFGLSTSSPDTIVYSQSKAPIPALGIYDGTSIILNMQNPGSWWENAKLLWRYGTAPISTLRLMRATVGSFLQMYEAPVFPFRSLTQVALDLGLVDVTAVTGEEFLMQNGVGGDFGREVVQASTRVNYAQDLNRIHGLETMVCMAAEGAMSVEGGNWRIFESMINASGADLRLETQVGLVKKEDDGKWTLSSTGDDGSMSVGTFDEVVLAAPMQYSGIGFPIGTPKHKVDKIPYVDLHVTLFTSKHLLSPMAFGLGARELVPQAILTTLPKDGKGTPPDFQSISLLREVINPHTHQTEYLYKVFSMREPNSAFLGRILGLGDLEADAEIGKRDISWMYRKLWQSYPYEYPRVTFEEIKLDDHFWYTSGIECFISTMETSSLMGMNVARLMTDEWMRKSSFLASAVLHRLCVFPVYNVVRLHFVVSREVELAGQAILPDASNHHAGGTNTLSFDAPMISVDTRAVGLAIRTKIVATVRRVVLTEALASSCAHEPEFQILRNYPIPTNDGAVAEAPEDTFRCYFGTEKGLCSRYTPGALRLGCRSGGARKV